MAQSNKILTVSYGTFSCTLEGFDNPFAAMQSVAEYFRDLAAEDRHFGAEPPQPDAKMLHQIAKREPRHRVDARFADDGAGAGQTTDTDEAGPGSAPPEAAADRLAHISRTAAKVLAERDRTGEEGEQVEDHPDEALGTASAKAEANDAPTDDESEPPLASAAKAAARSARAKPAPLTRYESDALSQASEPRQADDADDAVRVAQKSGDELDRPSDAAARSETREPPREKARGDEVERASSMAAIPPVEKTPERQDDESAADDAGEEAQSAAEESEDWVEVEVEDDEGTRVVRMSRSEFETALANGELEEIDDIDGKEPGAEPNDLIRDILAQTSLTEADAVALATELAAVELEPEAKDANARGAEPTQRKNSGDRTVSRLLDETDAQMGEPGGHRRRSAIQHLRTAVAATKADGGLRDRSLVNDVTIQKFRDDLQRAVRPNESRTADGSDPPVNPLGPLVLASSQRVGARVGMVRPVRTLHDDPAHDTPVEASEPEQATFSDFAAKLGAHDLPGLLEAAAAYSKVIEGQEGAPRPVLIRRATAVAPAGTASREEGLKSFGQLLRAGRLRKIDAGRFALADDAEIEKKARAAQ